MQGDRKVLIVDDDENLCYLLCAGLRLKGWNPDVVGNFGSALVGVKNGYDVVLLDPGLPDSMPLETIENLRRLKIGDSKVYIITGAPIDKKFHDFCIQCGATGVMSKNAREFLAGLVDVFGQGDQSIGKK